MLRLSCIAILTISGLLAQQAAPKVPTPVLYGAFLHTVTDFDRAAAVQEAQGKSGEELRSFYAKIIGLSDRENGLLQQVASAVIASVSAKDQEAQQIIQKTRAQFPGGRLPAGAKLPPPPPELKRLTAERDALVMTQVNTLRASLGAEAFSKLDGYVQTAFAKQVQPLTFTPRAPGSSPSESLSKTVSAGGVR